MKTPTVFYDYHLPREKIAQQPSQRRDASRLLVVHRSSGEIEHRIFRSITEYLQEGDLLVVNDTRVFPARMFFRKQTGARIEILFLRRCDSDMNGKTSGIPKTSLGVAHHKNGELWQVLARPGKRLKLGICLVSEKSKKTKIIVEGKDEEEGTYWIRLLSPYDTESLFEKYGSVPLPPYVHKPLRSRERYQTVYAAAAGSTAAPTAGLHFTPALMKKIRSIGCQFATITLHIGPATFRPIRSEFAEDHPMHPEWYSIPQKAVDAIINTKERGGRVIAVGTTSVRTLETWGLDSGLRIQDSGKSLISRPDPKFTNLYITEGFQFRVVDALVTNFHLPRSTLLILVSAFCGRELLLKAYGEAIKRDYRFYSFGDAMLII
ncbi:MAG: tRNA preQ1(34) S-adenosylmethionine ribosyltransferase-isomerase QueA [bacterium]